MENQKFLSIIIPIYNVEKYVGICLDSVLEQDIKHDEYEIICINDGSTDGSLQILQNYAAKYSNIVVIDKQNEGVSATRNLGIEKAQGEYIWFIDADDWIAKNCLGKVKSIVNKEKFHLLVLTTKNVSADDDRTNENFIKDSFQYKKQLPFFLSSIRSIIKTEVLIQAGIRFNCELEYGEDTFFMRECLDYLKLTYDMDSKALVASGVPIYFYRENRDGSAMFNAKKNVSKYLNSILKLAKMDLQRARQPDAPQWWIDQYRILVYNRMFDYMIYGLPSLEEIDIKEHLKMLKREGLYPCRRCKATFFHAEKGMIMSIRRFVFKTVFLYKLYYVVMKKRFERSREQ